MKKQYVYKKNSDAKLDAAFGEAVSYGNVKLAGDYIFWKKGMRWYAAPICDMARIYRRVEVVDTKVCCGSANFDIQRLVMVTKDGEELVARIGDGMLKEAQQLFGELQEQWESRGIAFGKP